ncbi:MAG: hypothetical protein CME70_18025 [Halobacteriovorax sp.]|nr:hypothetical protein [Halobacteriovorax sp.]
MKRSPPNATRLDEDWRPLEDYQVSFPALDLDTEFIKFQEYYINLTTKKAYKINWNLTWKKWLLNADKWQKEELANKRPATQTGDDQREALNRALNAVQNGKICRVLN